MKTKPREVRAVFMWITGLVSALPFAVFLHSFHQLYYFHDDWELLDTAARMSTIRWAFEPFLGDSVIPVFKILWISALHLFEGSYFGLIVVLWATHLAICLIFGSLLARLGIPWPAVIFAMLTFGLAWSNIETLGWSAQWGSQLALLFFLVALWLLLRILENGRGMPLFILFLVLSTLSSQRGVVSGLVLGVFVLLSAADRQRKAILFIVSLAPSVLLAALMFLLHRGNIDMPEALIYGAHYFLLNPLYHLLSIPQKTVATPELVLYGSLKVAVVAWALLKADSHWRPMLLTLVAFDLTNAVALGTGRFQLGVDAAVSWRYQYSSLLAFGPLAGLLLVRCQRTIQVAVCLIWILILSYPWKRHAPRWAGWRGSEIRARIAAYPADSRFDPSSITAGRARDLERLYHLH